MGLLWLLAASLPIIALVSRAGIMETLGALPMVLSARAGRSAILFGLAQAFGSLGVSLLVGLPGAWLLSRYAFPGRRILRAFSAVPFCMPPILVALGFVLYYGKNGYLNRIVVLVLGLDDGPIDLLYSFFGLCVVHGFYNFPLVLDIVGSSWAKISPERNEAARSLGAGRFKAFLIGTLPSLAPSLAESASLAFLFSFFSFIVVMIFGPLGASTPETEIFRLLRFSGDIASAGALALIQTLIAIICIAVLFAASRRAVARASDIPRPRALEAPGRGALAALCIYGIFLAVFFLAPLFSLIAESFTETRGFDNAGGFSFRSWQLVLGSNFFLPALRDSLMSALPSSLLATLGGLSLGSYLRHREWVFDAASSLPLAISGVVVAAGWHLLFPSGGIVVLVLIQALTALPFALRSSAAAFDALVLEPALAARSLGAGGLRAIVEIEIPPMLPLIFTSAAFSFSLSIGDATTPLMLGISDFEPLPLLVYRLTGAYRYSEACVVGLVLAILSGIFFYAKSGTHGDS